MQYTFSPVQSALWTRDRTAVKENRAHIFAASDTEFWQRETKERSAMAAIPTSAEPPTRGIACRKLQALRPRHATEPI